MSQTASFDDIADGEPTTPHSEPEDDTTEPNTQDPNEQDESSHDTDSNPSFDEASKDEDRAIYIYIYLFETGRSHCPVPRKTLDKAYRQLEPSAFKQAERVPKARKTGQEVGRRHQRTLTTNQNQQRQQRFHERHDLAHHGGRQVEMGLHGNRLCKLQTQTTTRPTTSITTATTTKPTTLEQTTLMTKVHNHNEGGADDDDKLTNHNQQTSSMAISASETLHCG